MGRGGRVGGGYKHTRLSGWFWLAGQGFQDGAGC